MKTYKKVIETFIIINIGFNGVRGSDTAKSGLTLGQILVNEYRKEYCSNSDEETSQQDANNKEKKPWNKKYIIGGVSGALFVVGGLGYWAYSNKKNKLIIVNEKKIKN